jgi:hypothetical protein
MAKKTEEFRRDAVSMALTSGLRFGRRVSNHLLR